MNAPFNTSHLASAAAKVAFLQAYYNQVPIVPVCPTTKRPLIVNWPSLGSKDKAQIVSWWAQHPRAMIGVLTGKASGLWALDIDNKYGGDKSLAELEARYGKLPLTPRQRTPGGARLWFRWPEGVTLKNRAGDIAPGLDVRGGRADGRSTGQAVIPPSVRSDGGKYVWEDPWSALDGAVDAPPWLLFLAIFGKRLRERLAAIGITGPDGFGDLPPTAWEAAARERLRPVGQPRVALEHELDAIQAKTLTTYILKAVRSVCDVLRRTPVGSQNIELNNAGLRIHGLLKGGEDMGLDTAGLESEALSLYVAAALEMPNDRDREPWEIEDAEFQWRHTEGAAEPRDLTHVLQGHDAAAGFHVASNAAGILNEPDMRVLHIQRAAPPPMPIEVFGLLAPWLQQQAEAKSAPVDYPVAALLASVAALVAPKRRAKVRDGWVEPSILWCAVVGEPSTNKSPGLDPILDALRKTEGRIGASFADTLRAYEAQKLAAETLRETWEREVRAAASGGRDPPPLPAGAEEPARPARPRVLIGDTTPEALLQVMMQTGGLLMHCDELAGWFGRLDRYGGGGDRQMYLECFGGRRYSVDRKTSPPITVEHMNLSIVGGIQPDRLETIFLTPDDDGLFARFLLFWPDPVVLKRPSGPVDDRVLVRAFDRLADLVPGFENEPVDVPFTRAGDDAVWSFQERMQTVARSAEGKLASSLGKFNGLAARLALILEYLWWAVGDAPTPPASVSEAAVSSATRLLENYFHPMLRRVMGDRAREVDRDAAMLAKHIVTTRADHINLRALRGAGLPGLGRKAVARIEAACRELEDAGWVTKTDGKGRGRPGKTYTVDPRVHALAAASTVKHA